MCIIDSMHNMLLGTARMVAELWKSTDVLSENDFHEIQKRVDSFTCPSEVGRLPSKIVYFSLVSLQSSGKTGLFISLYML